MIDDRQLVLLAKGLNEAIFTDKVNKVALTAIHQVTAKRIFKDGLTAFENIMGVYSKSYKKIRKKKNYPRSSKIILQATGRMVNDYSLLILPNQKYGSGFKQVRNFKISNWMEERFGTIWKLTQSEEKLVSQAYDDAIEQVLK